MASFENMVTIRRPVADVFTFLAHFENVPQWNYVIVETTKVSPGPVGLEPPTGRPVQHRAEAKRPSR